MSFSLLQDFISKIKHIFGYFMAILMAFSLIPGINLKTDKVDFKVVSDLTTESTEMTVEMKNRSLLSIEYEVSFDKFEKKVGEEWVEIETHPLMNTFPAVYRVYPEGCVLPFETYNCTFSFSSLCNQETLSAGDYRFVLRYNPWNNYTDFSTNICEFTVAQA